jgi:serine/tyrosine/threonine adenylyltransferase
MNVNDLQSLSDDRPSPFLTLIYEPALEALDSDYFDSVTAAEFPQHILRFRNDDLLPLLGLDPQQVTDQDFIAAFGQFQGRSPFLALRYHGYQFGEYNPALGDGRGFLYGQVRGTDGELYDFGTKGSGTTPYSRGGDGRLTLKGGVREVIAAEALHRMGVKTSRCLSLIETGEALWRGDEPSPTRSSVMIRFSRSHIRFGTFERLHFLGRKDLIQRLLEHVIEQYYPHLLKERDRYGLFYQELVQRVADLVAQWMAAGFCHAVLNTDNMSITGESFDYGPYAFINTFDPRFTAAYFDYFGRYSYGNQPSICYWNLEMLQKPLSAVISMAEMEAGLATFADRYHQTYRQLMLRKLGFTSDFTEAEALVMQTLQLLQLTQVGYHDFFADLAQNFSEQWRDDGMQILSSATFAQTDEQLACWNQWRQLYYYCLLETPLSEFDKMAKQLRRYNPIYVPIRPKIEAVWEPIVQADNWKPFNELLHQIRWTSA